jgi:chromate transporter
LERDDRRQPLSAWTVFRVFLALGLTSFGGPVAHLGYFREAFVERRRWIAAAAYADLVALCQFLPGPASSQVGIGIGLAKGGLPGAVAAWLGFTLPSALMLTAFGYGVTAFHNAIPAGVLHGLKIAAVAVVAQAVLAMARAACRDAPRLGLAAFAAFTALTAPTPFAQLGIILGGAVAGLVFLRAEEDPQPSALGIKISRRISIGALGLFFALLAGLPLLAHAYPSQPLALTERFYRAGALVFGGGHVVLPLLQAAVVPPGWVSNETFLAGYGLAQAVPGPLFTFAAYLGTVMGPAPNGWLGALICLAAIFAPSFLLVIGVLPFWEGLRHIKPVRRALLGINAAVVGLLAAALYTPVSTSAIGTLPDAGVALMGFALLNFARVSPVLVVALCAVGGWLLSYI